MPSKGQTETSENKELSNEWPVGWVPVMKVMMSIARKKKAGDHDGGGRRGN